MEAISSDLVFSRPFEPGAANLVFGEDLLVIAAIEATLQGGVSVAARVWQPVKAHVLVTLGSDVVVSALVLQAVRTHIVALLSSDVSVTGQVNVPVVLVVNQGMEGFTQSANAEALFILHRNARTWDISAQDRIHWLQAQDRSLLISE